MDVLDNVMKHNVMICNVYNLIQCKLLMSCYVRNVMYVMLLN